MILHTNSAGAAIRASYPSGYSAFVASILLLASLVPIFAAGSDSAKKDEDLISIGVRAEIGIAQNAFQDCDWKDAEQKLSAVLVKLPSPVHRESLRVRGMLVQCWLELGKLKEAESEITSVMATQGNSFGKDDPDTLRSRQIYALVLIRRGELKAAEIELESVKKACGEQKGVYAAIKADAIADLTATLSNAGEPAKALPDMQKVYSDYRFRFGATHPKTLIVRRNLVLTYGMLGKHEDVEREARKLLDEYSEKKFGPDHRMMPLVIQVEWMLAESLMHQNRLADAEGVAKNAVKKSTETKVENAQVLNAFMTLGNVLLRRNKAEDALTYFKQAFEGRKKSCGIDCDGTRIAGEAYISALLATNKWENALVILKEMTESYERQPGESGILLHGARMRYAEILRNHGRAKEAIPISREALKESNRLPGNDNKQTVEAENMLCSVLEATRDPKTRPSIELVDLAKDGYLRAKRLNNDYLTQYFKGFLEHHSIPIPQ